MTRVLVKSRSCDQGRRENGAFTLLASRQSVFVLLSIIVWVCSSLFIVMWSSPTVCLSVRQNKYRNALPKKSINTELHYVMLID